MTVHPSAVIHPQTKLAPSVVVGPFAVIGEGVELGEGCEVMSHAVLGGPTRMGSRNRIFPFASIGLDPQDTKYHGELTRLEMATPIFFVSLSPSIAGRQRAMALRVSARRIC